MEDAEGDWTSAVRATVGSDCMLAASYDLHGNVSQQVIDHLDLLTAYRTAPHRDVAETCERACRLLAHCMQQGIRPILGFLPVPVILLGEHATTDVDPGARLYGMIPEIIQTEGVLDASILVGYAWADEPCNHACVVVVGTEAGAVQQAALRLAQAYWDARRDFGFSVPAGTVDECIERALNAAEPCVFLSDAGDNPTGGGVGDVPYVLKRLLAHSVPSAVYAGIADAAAVAHCAEAGVGVEVSLTLGGKLDPVHGNPLPVRGTVIRLETVGGRNRHAVMQIDGVKVIITERRTAFITEEQFTHLGIDLLAHRIVAIKLGYLFPDLQRIALKAMLVLSPGALNPVLEQLAYARIQRPVYPLDPAMEWEPTV
jgi:microcystin degradation protein MlrC